MFLQAEIPSQHTGSLSRINLGDCISYSLRKFFSSSVLPSPLYFATRG